MFSGFAGIAGMVSASLVRKSSGVGVRTSVRREKVLVSKRLLVSVLFTP
jgi:hypothetical protein